MSTVYVPKTGAFTGLWLLSALSLNSVLAAGWNWGGGSGSSSSGGNSQASSQSTAPPSSAAWGTPASAANNTRLFGIIGSILKPGHHHGGHGGQPSVFVPSSDATVCTLTLLQSLLGGRCRPPARPSGGGGGGWPSGGQVAVTTAKPSTTTTTTTTVAGTAKTTTRVTGTIGMPTSLTNCTCVLPANCQAGDVVNFGAGNIDIRVGRLPCAAGQVCCTHPVSSTSTAAPATTATLSPLTGCGKRNSAGLTAVGSIRVVTTGNAAYGEFPWMVAVLERQSSGALFYLCGGSLLTPSVVLTAAHCVAGKTPANIVARLGEWDAAVTSEQYATEDITASSIRVHDQYDSDEMFNDIALVTLSRQAPGDRPNIGLACLPDPSDLYLLDQCVTIGWGRQNFNDPAYSALLRKTTVPYVERSTCQSRLQSTRLGSQFRLQESFICAGGVGADACTGDGGGPLMCPLASNSAYYIQVGIVSWGIGCGSSPGVYIDLKSFLSWIANNISMERYREVRMLNNRAG